MEIRCRHRLPSPELAGCCDIIDQETGEVLRDAVDALRDWAAQYPHLRPCKKHSWNWLYRKACAKCGDRIEVPLEGSEHEKGPVGKHRAKEDENMRVIHQNVDNSMPATGPAVKGKV